MLLTATKRPLGDHPAAATVATAPRAPWSGLGSQPLSRRGGSAQLLPRTVQLHATCAWSIEASVYLDAFALVKLIRDEPESESLRTFLDADDLISSELVLTEVPRAIRRAAAAAELLPIDQLIQRTEELEAIALLPVDRVLLATAGAITEPMLRSLNAIHVASAIDASPLDAFVSYDTGQSAAARLAGLRTMAPGIAAPRALLKASG
jgi:uncharacterized protein